MSGVAFASFSLVSIELSGVAVALAEAFRQSGRALLPYPQYLDRMTDALGKLPAGQPLCVSAGPADFAVSWLSRVMSQITSPAHPPPFQTLRVKHLDLALAERLQHMGLLEDGFCSRLAVNLQSLRSHQAFQTKAVSVETSTWEKLPPFHGWLIGEELFLGQWAIGTRGQLHVETPLLHTTKDKDPDLYAFAHACFPGPAAG